LADPHVRSMSASAMQAVQSTASRAADAIGDRVSRLRDGAEEVPALQQEIAGLQAPHLQVPVLQAPVLEPLLPYALQESAWRRPAFPAAVRDDMPQTAFPIQSGPLASGSFHPSGFSTSSAPPYPPRLTRPAPAQPGTQQAARAQLTQLPQTDSRTSSFHNANAISLLENVQPATSMPPIRQATVLRSTLGRKVPLEQSSRIRALNSSVVQENRQ